MSFTIPNKSAQVYASKPRGYIEASLTSTYAWWKMHQTSLTTLTESTAKTGFTGQTINGTTTNIWSANPGWFTPDVDATAAGNYVGIPLAQSDELCSLTDLAGGVLVVARIKLPGTPPGSGANAVFVYGANDGNYSGVINYGGNVNLSGSLELVGGANTSITSQAITAMAGGDDFTVAWYFDVANRQMSHYTDIGAGVVAKTNAIPAGTLPGVGLAGSEGLGVLGRNNPASTSRWNQSGHEALIRDLFMIRFETDQSANIVSIVQGFADNGGVDLPTELEGL